MSLGGAKLYSLKDKQRELSNEELQKELDALKKSNSDEVNKVEKPKVKKKK